MRCCYERYAHRPDCKFAPDYLAESIDQAKRLAVGDKVYFDNQRQGFTVRARDERFLICVKPFNARHTVLYSIVDLDRGVRGRDNLVFSTGYETQERIDENMDRLRAGQMEVSHRHHVQLRIAKVRTLEAA